MSVCIQNSALVIDILSVEIFYIYCRLLTLWFDYGQWPEVHEALLDGIKAIKIDEWLQVMLFFKKNSRGFIAVVKVFGA